MINNIPCCLKKLKDNLICDHGSNKPLISQRQQPHNILFVVDFLQFKLVLKNTINLDKPYTLKTLEMKM